MTNPEPVQGVDLSELDAQINALYAINRHDVLFLAYRVKDAEKELRRAQQSYDNALALLVEEAKASS